MRILVIDDEAQIRRLLEIALESKGWEVFSASCAEEGLDSARADKPDVILLDLNLPDLSGVAALARLREWSTVPVIVVSVRDAEEDIVALLDAGADDYVTKPFYTNVLVSRIQAVHRRRASGVSTTYRSGRLRFETGTREAFVDGERLRLTPTENAVLSALAREAGKIVTRDMLLKEVWGPSGPAEGGNLRVYVNALRKKIEADPSRPTLLTTESGVGYRLKAPDPEEGGEEDTESGSQ